MTEIRDERDLLSRRIPANLSALPPFWSGVNVGSVYFILSSV